MEASTTKDDEPCAYAKLWGQLEGKPFHTYVTALPSTLGRGSTATEGAKKPAGFIDLGRSKALSREHGEGERGRRCSFSNMSLDMLCPKTPSLLSMYVHTLALSLFRHPSNLACM